MVSVVRGCGHHLDEEWSGAFKREASGVSLDCRFKFNLMQYIFTIQLRATASKSRLCFLFQRHRFGQSTLLFVLQATMAKSWGQSESDMLPRWACTICYEEAKNNPVLTSCGHLFCWPCLYSWMGNMRRKPCPVCRTPLTVDVNILPIYDSTDSEPSSSSIPPRPRPIIRPPLLPPVQFNTAPGLPRNDILDMQRVPSYRAANTVAQVEEAARREHAAREMAQITEDLASVEEDNRNLCRMSLRVEEMRAPHASSH